MMLRIKGVLGPGEVTALRSLLLAADGAWVDGRVTAGYQGAAVKLNRQIDEASAVARQAQAMVLAALERQPGFISAALPNTVYPPMFNRYGAGMHFGPHVWQFDSGDNFVMGIFSPDESQQLGGTGLHPTADPGGLEIGYFIRESATRQGYVTESTAALTRLGFEVCGADRIEIRIDPANTASLGVPPKLGFVEEATLRRRPLSRSAI